MALPIISWTQPPNNVAQKPERRPASMAANQKMTGMTVSTNKLAAGTKILIAVVVMQQGRQKQFYLRRQRVTHRSWHRQWPFFRIMHRFCNIAIFDH